MAKSFFTGLNTYVVYAEDTAFGTAGTPAGTDYVDKVSSFTATMNNNTIRVHGIGEGRNATKAVNGNFDVSGSMSWELTDPSFLQYCFIAAKTGAGTVGDPYLLTEVDQIGYAAGQVNTLTLEVGKEGGANDDVMTFDGVVFDNFTIAANQGETVKVTAEWVGRTATSSTTVLTYTPPTTEPFTFIDGSLTVGSDTVGEVTGFSLVTNNNMQTYHTIGGRLISQPVAGIRRYEFTITMKLHYDDTASVLSGLEARGIFFTGATTGTTPSTTSSNTAVALSLDLIEGAASDDRVLNFDLENCYFVDMSEPVELEEGVQEVTITGYALAGLSNIPGRWYSIA